MKHHRIAAVDPLRNVGQPPPGERCPAIRYLAQHRQLSAAEIRNIRGRRLQRLGQLAYHRGASDKGFDFIWQAIKLGYQPLSGLLFMAGASKQSQWLKHKVLGR